MIRIKADDDDYSLSAEPKLATGSGSPLHNEPLNSIDSLFIHLKAFQKVRHMDFSFCREAILVTVQTSFAAVIIIGDITQ